MATEAQRHRGDEKNRKNKEIVLVVSVALWLCGSSVNRASRKRTLPQILKGKPE